MLRTSILTAGTSILMAGIALVNAIVTARGLGVEGRGIFAIAALVVSLGRVFGLMGLGDAYVRVMGQRQLRGREVPALYLSLLIVLLASLVSGLLATYILWTPQPSHLLIWLTIYWTVLSAGMDLMIAIARVEKDLKIFNLLRMLGPLIATLATIVVFLLHALTVALVVLIQLASALATLLLALVILHRKVSIVRWSEPLAFRQQTEISWRAFLRLGWKYHWVALLWLALTQAHMLIVMSKASIAAIGVYSAVYGLSRMVVPVQMAVGNTIFARSAVTSQESSTRTALRVYRLSTAPMILLGLLIAAFSPWIVPLLLGREFNSGVLPFAILVLEGVIGGSAFILGQQLQATGEIGSVIRRNLFSLLPVAIGAVFLGPENAVLGMSLLLLASALLRLLSTIYVFNGKAGSVWPFPDAEDRMVAKQLLGRK